MKNLQRRSLPLLRSLTSTRHLILAISIAGLSVGCGAPTVSNSSSNSQASDAAPVQVQATEANSKSAAKPIKNGGMNHGMDHSAMSLGPADADYDLRFIDGMVPHHEGAVIMAKEVLAKSKRPELKKLANEVIAAQDQEIAQMQQWRKAWYPQAGEELMAWHEPMNHMMAMSKEQKSAMRMDVDLGNADQDFDLRFINAMIPHHEGAVVMAKDAIQKSKRSDITKLSQGIISSQQAEIEQMKQWRKAWYNK